MRHSVFGKKLSRTANERQQLFAGLVRDLFLRGAVTTTLAKAKAVQPIAERLITKAKDGSEVARRRVLRIMDDRALVKSLFEDAKTRFSGRTSGYTRIIKLGKRLGDASDVAMLSFVDEKVVAEVVVPKKAETAKGAEKTEPKKETKSVKVPAKRKTTKATKKA